MSGLTYQQISVFQRITENNNVIKDLNAAIRGRANFVTAASTAIVGLITAAKYLPASNESVGVEFLLLGLVCLCSVGIYWLAALIWSCGSTSLAGTSDIDVLYESYISKDADIAFHNLLSDLCQALDENRNDNTLKASYLDRMVFVFIIQLVLLAASIAWGALAAYT